MFLHIHLLYYLCSYISFRLLLRHMERLYSTVDAPETSPAFCHSKTSFNHRPYAVRLKALLLKAGLDPALYPGHSFGRGGASYF